MTRPSDTLMWEVRAAPGRLADLLAWVGALPAPAGGRVAQSAPAALRLLPIASERPAG